MPDLIDSRTGLIRADNLEMWWCLVSDQKTTYLPSINYQNCERRGERERNYNVRSRTQFESKFPSSGGWPGRDS